MQSHGDSPVVVHLRQSCARRLTRATADAHHPAVDRVTLARHPAHGLDEHPALDTPAPSDDEREALETDLTPR